MKRRATEREPEKEIEGGGEGGREGGRAGDRACVRMSMCECARPACLAHSHIQTRTHVLVRKAGSRDSRTSRREGRKERQRMPGREREREGGSEGGTGSERERIPDLVAHPLRTLSALQAVRSGSGPPSWTAALLADSIRAQRSAELWTSLSACREDCSRLAAEALELAQTPAKHISAKSTFIKTSPWVEGRSTPCLVLDLQRMVKGY